jgi:hypothetical protein
LSCSVRRARTGATLVKSVDVNRCKPGRKLIDLVRYGALRAFLGGVHRPGPDGATATPYGLLPVGTEVYRWWVPGSMTDSMPAPWLTTWMAWRVAAALKGSVP